MHDLIKIENTTIGDASVPTVNARDLHENLEISTRYNDWIKNRIDKYGFRENRDFLCLTENLVTQTSSGKQGVSSRFTHYISLDMAKELCMVENSEKGRSARQYFIECEKKLHRIISSKQHCFLDIIEASDDIDRVLAIRKLDQTVIKPLEQFKEQALPKVDFFDTVTASEKLIDIGESSKVLLFKDLGRNNLFKVLRELEILDKNNVPYQKYVSRGYFKLIETTINGKPYIKTGVYQKGLDFLNKTLVNAGYEKLPR